MVVSSCLRLLLRRFILRKGLSLTAALFLVFGALGLLYFFSSNHYDQKEDTRTITVPPILQREPPHNINNRTNTSLNHPQDPQDGDAQVPVAVAAGKDRLNYLKKNLSSFLNSNSPKSIHVISDTTPECVFSSTQPLPGTIDIQTSDIMDHLDFANTNGGVWKQGFEISYSKDDLEMLKVFIVPHSHNDPGWLRTFEDYYKRQTRNILSLMTSALSRDQRYKFIWAEISYLDLWWREQNQQKRDEFKRHIQNGQLEIVTGGWVMNDEANTHYFAMLDQLIEGHLWMKQNLPGVTPQSGWANDPFGYTSTMAYLLSQMGLDAMMIQRVHYSMKKYLAQNKYLEFGWTQQWDHSVSDTAIFCHMMPFYSYDVPHTCGPDPKICCQFDFKRLKGNKVTCPWKIRPQAITPANVKERAETLADQYRKKSQLYRSNVLLVPLGDDFRWDTQKEIDDQFSNYFKLIDYINGHPQLKMNVQFGTLTDYFNAVKESLEPSRLIPILPANFPTLTGDFFTYSDKDNEFWSGYFTSRPFYKHFERVLETYLRRAEIFRSLVAAKGLTLPVDSTGLLTTARRSLGLFQHHDGITGTAKDPVVKDYANKMFEALTSASHITQAAVKSLLSSDSNSADLSEMTFDLEESYPKSTSLAKNKRIEINEGRVRVVTFVNSLAHGQMKKMVSLSVNTVNVMVKDHQNMIVPCQVNPVLDGDATSSEEFELVFMVDVPPLGISHYTLQYGTEGTVKATVQHINRPLKSNGNLFHVQKFPSTDFRLTNDQDMAVKFSGTTGLLKTVSEGSNEVTVDIDFVSYGTVTRNKQKSGAYLFLPDKEAKTIISGWSNPPITIVVGPLVQKVSSTVGVVRHCVQLFNSPGQDGRSVVIDNLVDVSKESNKEFAMRFRTSIDNPDEVFYTDLNGFQLVKRRTYSKLPIQGNYYPMPTTAVIQDQSNRLTLYSGQPLGVASLKKGWLEVMLDRRLMQDDQRGMGQGLKDNLLTFEPFRLLIERRLGNSNPTAHLTYPSLLGHSTLDFILHPLHAYLSEAPPPSTSLQPFTPLKGPLPCDLHLVNLRSMFDSETTQMALILHRRGFECGFDTGPLHCELTNGNVKLGDMFDGVNMLEATQTSLSLLHDRTVIDSDSQFSVDIDPMQIQAYRIVFQ